MDLASLSKLYTTEGPFVSLYLDSTSTVPDAAARWDTRWQNVLRALTDAGVDDATRAALTAARGDHRLGGTRAMVASRGQVHLAASLPEPPPRDFVRVGPLPHLLPLVAHLALEVPHVIVLADREGAEVLAYTTSGDPDERASLDTDRWPVHHTGVGGWSSKRYDNTVRNSWEDSAREVADLVDAVARDVDARLVIASGDERALALLHEHLPEARREHFTHVAGGGRHHDGSEQVVADEVLTALAEHIARDTLALLDRFSGLRGMAGGACDGVADTLSALRMSQVDTLLVTDAFERGDDPAWCGPDVSQAGLSEDDVRALGVDRPLQAPLVDVVLRAALGTGADVRVVAGDVEQAPAEGVGALLRFTTS